MGELSIRGNGGLPATSFQKTERAQRPGSGNAAAKPTAQNGAAATLERLIARVSQEELQTRQVRRSLQAGEAALAEVRDGLEQMEELARKALGSDSADFAALQSELEQLRGEIDRILQGSGDAAAPLSEEGEIMAAATDALLHAMTGDLSAQQEGIRQLPDWLLRGMAGELPDKAQILAALGLDPSASAQEVMEVLGKLSLEDSAAAGYLAALYLGAVIAGETSGEMNPELAAEGLRQLLEAMAGGLSPDEAIAALTNGKFTSLEDFQEQFLGGTAPGLTSFLSNFLSAGENGLTGPSLLMLLAGGGEEGLDLLMGLLAAVESSGMETMPETAGEPHASPEQAGAQQSRAQTAAPAPQTQTLELGGLRAEGRELSGVTADPETGAVATEGEEAVLLRGTGKEVPALRLKGSGTVGLHQVETLKTEVESPQARVLSQGKTQLGQVRLGEGTTLTVESRGLLQIGELRGGGGSVLRLTGGAVVLNEGKGEPVQVPVVVDGPVSLLAAQGTRVVNSQGQALEPFDLVWKTLFPEWNGVTALAVDGRESQLALAREGSHQLVRLWLAKWDGSQGCPAHTVALRGRDQAGQLNTQYIYLRWSQWLGSFQQVSMYPNPFTITGGEQEMDWRYEEESRTLHILTGQVREIAGGQGTDANQQPFSGRVALEDGSGRVELTLSGVECRVPAGRACSLGRGNQVTLLLSRGTRNFFESGTGCAGISLGEGTSLCIDEAKGGKEDEPVGALTATGGPGSVGIGWDGGVRRGQAAPVMIRGGKVIAAARGSKAKEAQRPSGKTLPWLKSAPQALRLDSLDFSTREAVRNAEEVLATDRRWVARLQEICGAVADRLERRSSGLHSVHRYIRKVRGAEEAGAVLGDMRRETEQSPMDAYAKWGMDGDVGELLRKMGIES